jgi:hypothetical protein
MVQRRASGAVSGTLRTDLGNGTATAVDIRVVCAPCPALAPRQMTAHVSRRSRQRPGSRSAAAVAAPERHGKGEPQRRGVGAARERNRLLVGEIRLRLRSDCRHLSATHFAETLVRRAAAPSALAGAQLDSARASPKGDGGMGAFNWIVVEVECPACQAVSVVRFQTHIASSYQGDHGVGFTTATTR